MSTKASVSKKRGRVVPSRFQQAAENYTGSSSKGSVTQSRLQTRSHSPRRFDKESSNQPLATKEDDSISRFESTLKHHVSTPTSEGPCTLPPIDVSIVAGSKSFLNPPAIALKKDTKKPSLQKNNAANPMLSCSGKKSNQVNECDQSEINLLYAEYLQAKYVESMTIKAFKTRCKDALDRIYEVWRYVGLLMDKNLQIEKDLSTVNQFIMAHEHLSKQEKILLPTIKLIPLFEKQYEEIAKAVDAARHNLETKDITLPGVDNEKEIVQLVYKATSLLNTILKCVQDSNKVITAAEAKQDFVNKRKCISELLERASETLSETSHLLVTETSLKLSLAS